MTHIPDYIHIILVVVVLALSAIIPLVSLVQSIGRDRQLHLLATLANYPVAQSLYYGIALNYFKGLEPFAITSRYFLPVSVLFLVTLSCATITYMGAEWTGYLATPNYVLGGAYILTERTP